MGTVHCQPTRDHRVFEMCMLAQCPHCTICMNCEAMRDLTWQSDSNLRAQLSLRNAGLHAKAAALDRIAPHFNPISQLRDQMNALQQQVSQLQQQLPTQRLHIQQQDGEQDGEQDGKAVPKVESMSDVEEFHTPGSTGDDLDDESDLKREPPNDGVTEHHHSRQCFVVITEEEQRKARRTIQRVQRSEREQPVREATLHTPRASIEAAQSNRRQSGVGGTVWTRNEDEQLLKGFRGGLSSGQIHEKYLPNRTADAIRKRKAKLQRG